VRLRLPPEAAGSRLDRALADRFPEHSRTAVALWIREGRVRVDGRVLPGKHRLAGGETVEVDVPPPRPTHLVPEDLPLAVLHEDEALLVLDKPPGLTVHPGAGQRQGTLANALAHHLRDLPALGGEDRPGIVHRLDKQTSGVIVVARTERAQRALSRAFAERTVEKVYLACVHGLPRAERGTIEKRIRRSPVARTKMTVCDAGGREAFTAWAVERRLPRHALLRCMPRTGRTHQIRVHLASIGHPIVGDATYGRRGAPGEALAPRLLLHAWRLAFPHPDTGARVSFEAPLPQDFRTALDALGALEPARRRPRDDTP
jgi:23S rRNA pseudouridine1911/1915/1917 synthase